MSRLQHNLHNEHSGIYSENITFKKKIGKQSKIRAIRMFCKVGWWHNLQLGKNQAEPVLGSGVKKRYQSSEDLTIATHQDKAEGRNTTQSYIFLILVTLLSTTERHFSLLGIIVLKAPTSFCNRSHSCIFRHSRDWWSCYFHFWLKNLMGRAHTVTVGVITLLPGLEHNSQCFSTAPNGSLLCCTHPENPCWIDPAIRREKANLVPGSQASLDV